LIEILQALAQDEPLSEKHRDHALASDWFALARTPSSACSICLRGR
jgi:mRNA-degrading endonuclease YafQ of YafQ-DinJ toxin-antitoxin module